MLNSRQKSWRQAGFQTHYHLILFKSYQTITLRLVDILSWFLRIFWDALETLIDALHHLEKTLWEIYDHGLLHLERKCGAVPS